MIIGVHAKGSYEYFTRLRKNFNNPKGLGVMLGGRVWRYAGLWVVKVEPRLPEFYKYGFVALIGAYLLSDIIGWWALFAYIPGVLMAATGVFWTKAFYQFILKKGLRKHAPEAKPRFYSGEQLIEAVLNGAT